MESIDLFDNLTFSTSHYYKLIPILKLKSQKSKEPRCSVPTMGSSSNEQEMDTVCNLLDKLTLRQLHLMEEKIQSELNIEANILKGTIHLAKSRYILGQSSVSATRLPTESSSEFSAATVCEVYEEDGVQQYKAVENKSHDIINPIKWFGVLVPQNLYNAQNIFYNTLNYVVECVNIQIQLNDIMDKVHMLKQYKKLVK